MSRFSGFSVALGGMGMLVLSCLATPIFAADIHSMGSDPAFVGVVDGRGASLFEEGVVSIHWVDRAARKPLDPERRPDLKPALDVAAAIAHSEPVDCDFSGLFELRMKGDESEWIAGYEVIYSCSEAPRPALSIVFDIDGKPLRTSAPEPR